MSSKVFKQVLEDVVLFFKDQKIPLRNTRMGVAVSGGADSTALLLLMRAVAMGHGVQLHVLHFDHRMQSQSRQHVRFVAEICSQYGIPFSLGRWTFPKGGRRKSSTLPASQARARDARYQFFVDKARELNLQYLALAHNAEDLAETLLWRLLRGASPTGLVGIRPVSRREDLILLRPVLEVQRRTLETLLQDAGQSYCEDPSNAKTVYLRNKIRHELLPLLEAEYHPKVKSHLQWLSKSMAAEDGFMEAYLTTWLKRRAPGFLGTPEKSQRREVIFPRKVLLSCPPGLRLRLFTRILKQARGFNLAELKQSHFQALQRLVDQGQGSFAFPSGWSLHITAESVILKRLTLHSPLAKKTSFR